MQFHLSSLCHIHFNQDITNFNIFALTLSKELRCFFHHPSHTCVPALSLLKCFAQSQGHEEMIAVHHWKELEPQAKLKSSATHLQCCHLHQAFVLSLLNFFIIWTIGHISIQFDHQQIIGICKLEDKEDQGHMVHSIVTMMKQSKQNGPTSECRTLSSVSTCVPPTVYSTLCENQVRHARVAAGAPDLILVFRRQTTFWPGHNCQGWFFMLGLVTFWQGNCHSLSLLARFCLHLNRDFSCIDPTYCLF